MSLKEDTKRAFAIWKAATKEQVTQQQWEDDILSRPVYEILRRAALGAENDKSGNQNGDPQVTE